VWRVGSGTAATVTPAPPPPAPIADPLPVAVAAPRPTEPAFEASTTPCAATPGTPVPPPAPYGAVADLLPRARAASVAGRHGEALGLWKEARGLPGAGSADAWAPVVARAEVWAEEHLRAAVRSAREHRWSEAAEHIAVVRREAPERPCAKDAAVGERAVERLRLLEGGSGGGSTLARSSASAEFQGTRWTRVFVPLP